MNKHFCKDAIMGLVTGDALGGSVQFMSRDELRNRPEGPVVGMEACHPFDLPEGSWSDDSSMSLATLDSIIKNKSIDLEDIMERFVNWMLEGDYTPYGESFDVGRSCFKSIAKYSRERNASDSGLSSEYDNGNGSLMRIMPACLFYYYMQQNENLSDRAAIDGIYKISGITHNHLRAKICCAFYYYIVRELLDTAEKVGANERSLEDIISTGISYAKQFYRTSFESKEELKHLERLMDIDEFKQLPEDSIKSSGYVVDTLEAALWSLLTTSSYKEAMLKAVNLGEDTDSIAAVAGGIAGLYYGYDSIPPEWLETIKRRDYIEGMCSKADLLFSFDVLLNDDM